MEPPITASCLCARPLDDPREEGLRQLGGPLCRLYGRRGWPTEEIAAHYGVRAPRELPPCSWDEWERGLNDFIQDDNALAAGMSARAEGEDAMVETRVFTLDGEPVELEELIEVNRETFDDDEIDALRAMRPGDSITFGGGAWAESVVACLAAPEAPC